MTYRNRKLLDAIHDLPCMADFDHACTQHLSVVPAHSDSLRFGRGAGHKASDWAVSAMCNSAHNMLDTLGREEKFWAWHRAFVKTQEWLWENERVAVV